MALVDSLSKFNMYSVFTENVYWCSTWAVLTLWTLSRAVDRDVTRAPAISIIVLPLADAGWTLSNAHTLDVTIGEMPDAGRMSGQKFAITLRVDWRPFILPSFGLIAAEIVLPLPSCCSGGGECDWVAASWWRIRKLWSSGNQGMRRLCFFTQSS